MKFRVKITFVGYKTVEARSEDDALNKVDAMSYDELMHCLEFGGIEIDED